MDLSKRNRKVAISRWSKILKSELEKIPSDKESLKIKAGICGFLAGDGSVQVRKQKTFSKYQLDLFADDKKMANTYLNFIYKIYQKSPSLSFRDNMYVARLSQKFVVLDLLGEAEFGIHKWSFPDNLFKVKGAKENWLRAFFSAEGYVNKKVIKIQSVNVKSIKKVFKLLKEFDINGNYYEYHPKNKKHSIVGMIFINNKKSRVNYFNKIGFWHERKSRLLKESLGL